MAAPPKKNPVIPGWHASLKSAFNDADLWWQHSMVEKDWRGKQMQALQSELDAEGAFIPRINTLHILAHTYAMESCTRESILSPPSWALAFSRAVEFRALDFRKLASLSLPFHKQTVLPFWSSLKAAGPTMVSQWELAEVLAKLLIAVAEKDVRIDPNAKDGWGRGTNDAFLVYLFSEAFSISTTYAPGNPLVSEYQAVLANWRTTDVSAYSAAMSAAAEFHISRSRDTTNKVVYEFDDTFDRVYPVELLAVQALRRRDGLPEVETGHLLIDKPWSLIRDLPEIAPPFVGGGSGVSLSRRAAGFPLRDRRLFVLPAVVIRPLAEFFSPVLDLVVRGVPAENPDFKKFPLRPMVERALLQDAGDLCSGQAAVDQASVA